MSLLPFAAFAVLALASRTLLNWAYVAFAPGIVLVAAVWVRGNYHRWLKWSLGVCLALIIAAQHLPTWTKLAGVELKARQDPYSRTKGWKELGRTVTAVWRTQPGTRILADDRWIMAELLYYVDPAPRNAVMWNPGGPITDHYRLTRDAGSLVGESFLYVTAAADIVALAPYFSRTQLVHQETITTHKESWRVYYLYRLDGFKGY
jgi:hypothetical protein